jgi:hypothetical protein
MQYNTVILYLLTASKNKAQKSEIMTSSALREIVSQAPFQWWETLLVSVLNSYANGNQKLVL